MFEEKLFRQIIDFPKCGNNILDTAFYQNCHLSAELNKSFPSIYNLTDHEAISLSLENPLTETKPLIQNFGSFGIADYDAMNEHLVEKPFQSICYTNINKMREEFTRYLDGIFDLYVAKRTRHRQSQPPWISCGTSNLINRLKTQKRLLENKPTSYRKQLVLKLEIQVTDSVEEDRVVYQENLLGSRNTDRIFKHLKSLNKSACLLKVLMKDTEQSSLRCEQVIMFNQFFHSVLSPKTNFSLKDFKVQKPSPTNFDISKNTIRNIMDDIDATKSRGPNGIPPVFYVKVFYVNIMHSVLRNIKRLRKIPDSRKIAAITPVFKKGDPRKVENYRPVSLLNIDSKILEKCLHIALYNHFQNFLTNSQHGFARRRSVQTNMLLFLKRIYEALDHDPQSKIIAFYTDFSKAFDKVLHYELIQKLIDIGVGGCLLEILIDYLSDRRQYVRVDNTSSKILDITSGVPPGSLLGPLLFYIFINDLPDVLMFSEPFIFADDLKNLAVQRSCWEVQDDLHGIQNWIIQNKMELAIDMCAYLNFRGRDQQYKLKGKDLAKSTTVKDLGIDVAADV